MEPELSLEGLDEEFINSLLNPESSPADFTSSDLEAVSSPSTFDSFFNFDSVQPMIQIKTEVHDVPIVPQPIIANSSPSDTRIRSNKRPRHERDMDVSSVSLSREQLLKLSSEQLTQYFKDLAKTRKFTSAEEKEIRRQRRLVKNRESAQNSRLKKKTLLEELERKVEILEEDKRKMTSEILKLRAENKMLLDEVKTLRNGRTCGSSASSYVKGRTTGSKHNLPVTVKTTTTLVLIFLFAFSIYFSASNSQNQNPFPKYVEHEPIPEVAPSTYASSPIFEQIREARYQRLFHQNNTLTVL